MTAKHTPGPWGCDLLPDGSFHIEKDPNNLGRYMVIATRCTYHERRDEMHANARLIAAAPELLEALEFYLSQDEIAEGYGGGVGRKAQEKARAAIAKASGGGL